MANKNKGLFKDNDKKTKRHQEMSIWFSNEANVFNFLRFFLLENVVSFKSILEEPIISENGFLYGFADVVLKYQTDQKREQVALIELKTSSDDFGQTLRQIRTYQKYIGNVQQLVLIDDKIINDSVYEGPGLIRMPPEIDNNRIVDDYEISLKNFFGSQGIYVKSFKGLKNDLLYDDKESAVPSGLRTAFLADIKHDEENCLYCPEFEVITDDGKFSFFCNGPNFYNNREKLFHILKKTGLMFSDAPFKVNLVYKADKKMAYPKEQIISIHCQGYQINFA